MAQSVKLKDGSYIDDSMVWDATQKNTAEALLGDLFTLKDCSSEIKSKHSSIVDLTLYGLGKIRYLSLHCIPNGTLDTNNWVFDFVTFNKGPVVTCVGAIAAGNSNNTPIGASAFVYSNQISIQLGGQSYPEGSSNYFMLSAVYFVS